jgi:very-short-patch-repair endonuclease
MTDIRELVRSMRKNQTEAEKVFWNAVRNRQVKNKKILRQYALIFEHGDSKRFFVPDFICVESALVIEIDGKIHEQQKDYDELRSYLIKKMGYRVIRFRNEEVLNDLGKVISKLAEEL